MDVHQLWLDAMKKYPEIDKLWYNIQPASAATVQIGEDRGGNCMGIEKVPQTCEYQSPGPIAELAS